MKAALFLIALLIALASADIYLHVPRGSNNRRSEANTNRNNANRLYDSQNNGKGGYCWAPTPTYYEQSFLQVEWTNQHGCGTTHSNVDCDLILQYMCHPDIRDGTTTERIPFNEDGETDDPERRDANGEFVYGKHESYTSFRRCNRRRRNKGLFYADQNNPLSERKSARYTRQGNDATRYGYECPEERDYYPYWHPTEWKDIAIFTSRVDRCDHFRKHSQNVADKWWCVGDEIDSGNVEYFETEEKCEGQGTWERVEAWNIGAPECYPAGWNRDNHLGNGPGGYANSYKWVLPAWGVVNGESIEDERDNAQTKKVVPCVFRIRYNISSGDYRGGVENKGENYENGGFADSTLNGANSPVKQDPYILYGKHPDLEDHMEWPLVLAINTNQFGRTFEDRSHMFYIKPLPLGTIGNVFNLMIRGKRGNIVQTYPAVEYDFSPNNLHLEVGDFIHFQVQGCDTNPQGNDGEGRRGTDRSNIVQIHAGADKTKKLDASTYGAMGNYPVDIEKTTMWGLSGTQKALENTWTMAHINQYGREQCISQTQTGCCLTLEQLEAKHGGNNNGKDQDPQNCAVLNGVGGNSFDSGLVKMTEAGTFHYMSSRNNNFTNRSQKGTIVVGSVFSAPTIIAMAAGGGAAVVAVVVSAISWSGGGIGSVKV